MRRRVPPQGLATARAGTRVGYVHLDNHLDMFDANPVWGPIYHGSTVRRVSEFAGLDPADMLLVGQTGLAAGRRGTTSGRAA